MLRVPESRRSRLDLQIVNLCKRYVWHRAPPELEDDEPDLPEDDNVLAHPSDPGVDRWALRGINAVIKPGERVGIIGSNGSGKTTLLNILAGITLPSSGYVRGRGLRVLLNSLHTPFRGQLTGRQNLHVLAALLGVSADRLEARLPEILAFSDMEHFIDRRVMHYSTQQYRRLTFATALMLDPEIILSDDTLGIGDARYQQRTEQLIAEKVENDGVIFIYASNNLSRVQELCTRVIWLEDGRVAADGLAERVIEAFSDADSGTRDEPIGEIEEGNYAAEAAQEFPPIAAVDSANSTLGFGGENSPPSRMPLPEWSRLAQDAVERRRTAKQERIKKWDRTGRPWLAVEKASANLPGTRGAAVHSIRPQRWHQQQQEHPEDRASARDTGNRGIHIHRWRDRPNVRLQLGVA